MSSITFVGGEPAASNGSTYVNYQEEDECIDDAFDVTSQPVTLTGGGAGYAPATSYSAVPSASYGLVGGSYPAQCLVLYNFQVVY